MLRGRDHPFDFGDCNRWQVPAEEQEQGQEHAEASEEHQSVKHRRAVVAPRSRQEIPAQRRHRDHKAFEPHADVDKDGNNPHRYQVRSEPFEPKQLRRNHVAGDHDPIGPPIWTKSTVDKRKSLVLVAAIPSHEKLGSIR